MRRRVDRLTMVAAALAACLIGTHTQAEIILGEHDWENGAEGWAMLGSETWVTLEDPAVGENWLNIALTGQTASWSTVVKVQAEDLFAGTWTPDMFVEFDFWAAQSAPLSYGTDWIFSGGGSSEDQYLSDLSSIDWIGISLGGSSGADPSYQPDNFRLMIPEPSQYVMLSSAILACLAAVRRRKNDKQPPTS
jgi:hypothetical protein